MKRFSGTVCLLFVVCMISSPLLISVEAIFEPAQTTPLFSGELLPDPDFAQEPYVEIGAFSPEFDYEYTPGSVTLIWAHTSGYELDYGSYGGYYGLPCHEYAQVLQTFESSYNESIVSIKLSANVSVDCTGDFAAEDFPDDMWEVQFGIYFEYGFSNRIRTISDLKNGDSEEISFMLSELETFSYFYGPERSASNASYSIVSATVPFSNSKSVGPVMVGAASSIVVVGAAEKVVLLTLVTHGERIINVSMNTNMKRV